MATYFSSLLTVLQPMNLAMLLICSIIGVILGAIPGLSGGLGLTLILPLTFALNTEISFCMLLGMYVGGMSGAFIASVLVGIPGTPASICTCYDGYPMTKNGKASKALTIGLTASFMGTAISIIVATVLSGFIADIALMLVVYPVSSKTLRLRANLLYSAKKYWRKQICRATLSP